LTFQRNAKLLDPLCLLCGNDWPDGERLAACRLQAPRLYSILLLPSHHQILSVTLLVMYTLHRERWETLWL